MKTEARLILTVDDIPCAACADDLEKILLEMEGICRVKVEYGERRMEVFYFADVVDDKDILRRVMKVGIKVIRKEGSR